MENVMSKASERALRRANAERYKPRGLTLHRAVVVREDPQLRRITAKVLEQLKRPDAIPSRVVMSALAEARALGATA